ncbi:MAG: DNA polymerase III subunit beta, partial [Chloroflexota bacterium]
MKVQIEKLRQALKLLKPAVPRKTTLPVTTHVRLGEGKVVATDLETGVTISGVGEPQDGEAAMCLPYKLLCELLASMPGYEIADITLADKVATITAGSTTLTLNALPGEDFPPIPDFTPEHEAAVDGDALVKSLTAVLPYVAKEISRPTLAAVCLTLGENPEAVAADGFRLVWHPAPKLAGEGNLLIPSGAVEVLEHLWKHAPKPPDLTGVDNVAQLSIAKRLVRVEYSQGPEGNGKLRVTFGEVSVLIQLVAGTFPNYHQLIPKHTPSVTFHAPELFRGVKLVGAIAKDGSGIVRLSWEGGHLQVQARADEVGSSSITIPAQCHREGRIAFNLRYLVEYLNGKDGMATLSTDSPSSPGLFSYRGVADQVLMPMFVNSDGTPKGTKPPAEATAAEEPAAGA